MSELITTPRAYRNRRLHLFATVSVLALMTNAMPAAAQDRSHPVVWIELGAQYESITGQNDPFVPPFDAAARDLGFPSITEVENALGKSFGGEGSLSFQPHGSDWIFMASARYGRTHTTRHGHAQTAIAGPPVAQYLTPGGKHFKSGGGNYLATPSIEAYVDQHVDNAESHSIMDFQVGRDVGLGLFGRGTESVFGFGARFLQMNTSSRLASHTVADGYFHIAKNPLGAGKYSIYQYHHNSASTLERYGNLRAFGPSLSLANTTNFVGNPDDGELSLDWGANVAVLFGRQRTHVSHQMTTKLLNFYDVQLSHSTGNHRTESRRVTVPNVGGFVAASYRLPNAKVSMGYRADFFFGALDRGLDARDAVTAGFHGPFATVSFGLGG